MISYGKRHESLVCVSGDALILFGEDFLVYLVLYYLRILWDFWVVLNLVGGVFPVKTCFYTKGGNSAYGIWRTVNCMRNMG